MRDSYNKLGMDDKAADIQRILDANKNRGSYDTYLRAQELEAAQRRRSAKTAQQSTNF